MPLFSKLRIELKSYLFPTFQFKLLIFLLIILKVKENVYVTYTVFVITLRKKLEMNILAVTRLKNDA